MKNPLHTFVFVAYVAFSLGVINANAQPRPAGFTLSPPSPTTADNITAKVTIGCAYNAYTTNPYRVSMAQNNITVRLGEYRNVIVGVCPPTPDDEIDLGRLPMGSYTLTVVNAAFGSQPSVTLVDNAPFNVTLGRPRTQRPSPRLDYSGSWWNPDDPGSGLFITQDPFYGTLATWFTYATDGKPQWYVFQPTWSLTSSATPDADLLQTSRMPSPSFPPPNPTTNNIVGTASLDFTNFSMVDKGVLTIALAGRAKQVINIQRLTR